MRPLKTLAPYTFTSRYSVKADRANAEQRLALADSRLARCGALMVRINAVRDSSRRMLGARLGWVDSLFREEERKRRMACATLFRLWGK